MAQEDKRSVYEYNTTSYTKICENVDDKKKDKDARKSMGCVPR